MRTTEGAEYPEPGLNELKGAQKKFYARLKALEETALLQHMQETGEFPSAGFVAAWKREGEQAGTEHKVAVAPDGRTVRKFGDAAVNHTWTDYLQRIALHNSLFPLTEYEYKGLSTIAGHLHAVVDQVAIAGENIVQAKQADIDAAMKELGFEPFIRSQYAGKPTEVSPMARLWVRRSDNKAVWDIRPANVLQNSDTKTLYFIDPVVEQLPDGYDIGKLTPLEIGEDGAVVGSRFQFIDGEVVPRDDAQFKLTGSPAVSGVKAVEAQAWVSTLPIAKRVNVVQSIDDLPAAARSEITKAQVNPARVQAMELQGTIHVIADNVPDLRRVKALVIGHELAHAGQTDKVVDIAVDWFTRNKDTKTEQALAAQAILEKVAAGYGYNLDNVKQFRRAVQEATAALAEQVADGTLKPIGLMHRLMLYLKHWLRQNGLISHVSDSELYQAVAEMLRIGEKRLSVGKGGDEAQFAAAWHGGPHDFSTFDSSKIGTGEGNQAYGYGLYFAGNKEVAEFYKDMLSKNQRAFDPELVDAKAGLRDALAEVDNLGFDTFGEVLKTLRQYPQNWFDMYEVTPEEAATISKFLAAYEKRIKETQGKLYQVELAPSEDEYLLWDKPLSEQSETVKTALAEYGDYPGTLTGKQIYKQETGGNAGNSNSPIVSQELHSLGIRGIKYLDGTSRGKGEGNYNYVIFNSADVEIKAKFALSDEIKSNIERVSESTLLGNLKGIVEPGTLARFAKNIPDAEDVKDTLASILANDTLSGFAQDHLQTPLMVTEQHPDFLPVYETAKERDENKMNYVVRMLGGLFDKEGKPALWDKVKDTLFNWDTGKETAYGQLLRETKLTSEERRMYDELVFEADIMGAEYSSLEYANRNPRIKKMDVTPRVFDFYQKSMALQESARKVHIAIIIELMHKAGASLEKIAATLARNHAETEDVSEESLKNELMELMAEMEKEGKSIDTIARHVADYRGMVLKRKGRVHRNHGEGNRTVDVFHHITSLDFDADTVSKETDESRKARQNNPGGEKQTVRADRVRLPGWNFPGNDVVREIKKIVDELEGSFKQTDDGALIMLFSKGAGAKALQQFKDIRLLDESGAALHKNLVYRRFVASKGTARKQLRNVKKDLAGAMPVHYRDGQKYSASIGFKEQVSEDMYRDAIGEMATEQILNASINKALAHGEIGKDEAKAMKEAFIQDIAESFMARGAGSYQIRRLNRLIEGYDRTGALGKFESYVQGVSGMLSKAQYSFDQHENLKHVTPEMKDYAYTYIKDTLRNMGTGDQWSGNARAIASIWYLGYNFSWMLVNSTQPYVLGQSELSRETTSPVIKIAKAEKDILTGNLSAEEKSLFDEMSVRSSDHDSVMNEMAGAGDGGDGKWSRRLGKAVQTSMAVGQKIEVLNRHTMILAAYRVFKGEKGQAQAEALKNALRVNSMVNIDMGRHNLPKFARTALGRTLYTLASYIQHMLNLLYQRSTSGNRADQKAVLRLLFAMFLLGGLPAGAPGSDELDKLILKFFGYSPKLALKAWTRKQAENYDSAGEMVDAFLWHGMPGAGKPLGIGVSLTGATQLRVPIISSVIAGDDMTKAVGGPIGGLVSKAWMAGKAAQRNDYWRMTEYLMPTAIANPLSAVRQATDGVKTASGKRVEYKGKQLKMEPHEAAIRAFGLQPVRTADISETRGFEKGTQAEWNDRRKDALDNYRMSRQLKYIQEFNKGLRGSQAQGLVSPITPESLANVWGKTNQKKNRWEREHGVD